MVVSPFSVPAASDAVGGSAFRQAVIPKTRTRQRTIAVPKMAIFLMKESPLARRVFAPTLKYTLNIRFSIRKQIQQGKSAYGTVGSQHQSKSGISKDGAEGGT
jgi:hypothetical protein